MGQLVKKGGMEAVKAYYEALGPTYMKAFADMLVLDAVIFNTDRHFGNFGFLVDTHTNQIVSLAPLFDHGNSLFNLAGQDDFVSDESLTAYAETLFPCVYDDFVETAKPFLSYEHRKGLRRLLDFHFKKHSHYNLSADRLARIEYQIQKRAKELLENETKERTDDL